MGLCAEAHLLLLPGAVGQGHVCLSLAACLPHPSTCDK